MSVMNHPTMSAWQRQEDGSYAAEINGWNLRVKWRPESPEERRGFYWIASRPGVKLTAHEVHEEIEVAMALAEDAADPNPRKHDGKTFD
jgi:hypothetical protein